MKVEIYSKPDCPLCEEAKRVLLEVQRRVPFQLSEVNIEGDASLFQRYRYDIPVIFIDGHKSFKHRVEARDLERRLQHAAGMGVAIPPNDIGKKVPND
ncbi:MAG TPA: glutaredoxin family protein [Myxococcaceae bacterium]|nr:glutaredoxin family protein [Myxococcaceae bacterium]